MPITLLCLVKGNTTANAFPVDIDKDQLVGHLKKVIKAEQPQTFANVDAKDLKLWKVTIPDDQDDQLRNLILQNSDELLAIRKISKYFPDSPPEEHIHVLVEPPETTATSSREQELLNRIALLEESLNKSVYEFDVVVSPKRKAFKWAVNIKHATLEGLKDSIRAINQTPALENDGTILNIMNDGGRYSPRNDASFREILRQKKDLVPEASLKFTVYIETPSKPFNKWTFPKVCELYGLSDDPNPDIDVFTGFSCGSANLSSEKSKAVVKHLMAELNLRKKTTPLILAYETTKSIYSYCYLASGVSLYKKNFKIVLEKLVKGHNGQGNLNLAIECRSTGRIVGLVEVKKDDFKQGFAQATVQMESSLTCRKRKANEIDDENDMDKVWGIVTDAEKWYFMECLLDNEGKPSFKLSEPVTVVYKDENLQAKVEKVLEHIVWLLEEAQKPVEALQTDEQTRLPKKQKSSSNLAGKSG